MIYVLVSWWGGEFMVRDVGLLVVDLDNWFLIW